MKTNLPLSLFVLHIGISYQPDKVELKVGGAPKCPRCDDRVYFNEEKKSLGKSWHNRCFSCASCNKKLDSTNCAGHGNEIYCVRCHRKEFGPKGYGFAGGMAGLQTESTYNNVRSVSPINTHVVAEQISCKTFDPAHPDSCRRCGKLVYFAEEIKALGRKWHKLCFKCAACNKLMEPGRCNEHNSELYCQGCYLKDFGPSGYGFAGGTGSFMSSELRDHHRNPHRQQSVVSTSDMRSSMAGNRHEWTEGVLI